jgi:hypothetical protein
MVLGFKKQFPEKIINGEKIHTIRKGYRWKAGTKIHFATGVRTKNYNQFNSGVCVSVQSIEIYYPSGNVIIDGELFHKKVTLARNDGFDSFEELQDWFGKGIFKGQIIHWTDFKY